MWLAAHRLASTVDGQPHSLILDGGNRHGLLTVRMHSTISIQLLSNALQQSELCLAECIN